MPHDALTAAMVAALPAAPTSDPPASGQPDAGPPPSSDSRHDRLATTPTTDACGQFARCFAAAEAAARTAAPRRAAALADDRPVDPNDPRRWTDRRRARRPRSCAATASPASTPPGSTCGAVRALIDGQAAADRDAGLDWTRITAPASRARRRAAARARAAADRPRRPARLGAPRATSAARSPPRSGSPTPQADDLAELGARAPRRASTPTTCAAGGSPRRRWLRARRRAARTGRARRAAGRRCSSCPRPLRDGWQLVPALSLDAIRAARRARRPDRARPARRDAARSTRLDALLERVNPRTLHAGGREALDSGRRLGEELTRALERPCSPGAPRDARDRWGRLLVTPPHPHRPRRHAPAASSHLRVLTFAGARLHASAGSAPRRCDQLRHSQAP